MQRIHHEVGVVAIRKVLHPVWTGAECIQNQRTIADAFRGGELNRRTPSSLRSCYQIIHVCPSLEYSEGKSRKKQLHVQELLLKEEDLIVYRIIPVRIVMRTRTGDEVMLDTLFQQVLMQVFIHFEEEIILATVHD